MSVIFTFRAHPMSILTSAAAAAPARGAALKASFDAMDAATAQEQATDAAWAPGIFVNSHLPVMAPAVAARDATLKDSATQARAADLHRQMVTAASRFGRYDD